MLIEGMRTVLRCNLPDGITLKVITDRATSLRYQAPLVRWLRVNFSDSFIAWIHVKVTIYLSFSKTPWFPSGKLTHRD